MAVNDVRTAISKACDLSKTFTVEEWIPQSEFYARPDRVEYTDANGNPARRYIRPDGYLILRRGEHLFRFLLELDMATESNLHFAREKVLPGLAYLKSKVYEQRFGHTSGRFLVVTTGERKLRNMKGQTERAAGKEARHFYFTTFAQIHPDTVFTEPIWFQGGEGLPGSLF